MKNPKKKPGEVEAKQLIRLIPPASRKSCKHRWRLVPRAKALNAAFKARLRCEKRRGDAAASSEKIEGSFIFLKDIFEGVKKQKQKKICQKHLHFLL